MGHRCFCYFALTVSLLSISTGTPTANNEFGPPSNSYIKRTSRQSLPPGSTYSISRYDLMAAISRLEKVLKEMENKLVRHEFRERQVADFSTKTLNALNADHVNSEKKVRLLSIQLVQTESKVVELQEYVKKSNEQQSKLIGKIAEGLNLLISKGPAGGAVPPLPPDYAIGNEEIEKQLKNISEKVAIIEEEQQKQGKEAKNEMTIVEEKIGQAMDQLTERHDRLWTTWSTCESSRYKALSDASLRFTMAGESLSKQISNTKKALEAGKCSSGEVTKKLESLNQLYKDQDHQINEIKQETNKAIEEQYSVMKELMANNNYGKAEMASGIEKVIQQLHDFDQHSKDRLGNLSVEIKTGMEDNSDLLRSSVDNMTAVVGKAHSHILDALDDAASQADNIQNTAVENYEDLSKEIKGLHKVEQVMINTADAVLDTKRSMEFGIQQVILELSDIVKHSGKTINSTLSDQINNISFAILKNQTSALTNMTSKMETEISQVWRQIGIMYQQLAQSVNILDDLQNTTKQHMNVSLSRVGSMDGTVGKINTKVADVEDNLNYLLGRLSLVTSEFSNMKYGLGEELERLRLMAQTTQNEMKEDIIPYNEHKKREIPAAKKSGC